MVRAAFGISRTFFHKFLPSGFRFTRHVHLNIQLCRAVFCGWFCRGQRPRLQHRAKNLRPSRAACPTSPQWHTSRNEELGGVVEWLMAPVLKFEVEILDSIGRFWTRLFCCVDFS